MTPEDHSRVQPATGAATVVIREDEPERRRRREAAEHRRGRREEPARREAIDHASLEREVRLLAQRLRVARLPFLVHLHSHRGAHYLQIVDLRHGRKRRRFRVLDRESVAATWKEFIEQSGVGFSGMA